VAARTWDSRSRHDSACGFCVLAKFAGRYVSCYVRLRNQTGGANPRLEHHRSPAGGNAGGSGERRSADAAGKYLNATCSRPPLRKLTDAACRTTRRCKATAGVLERAHPAWHLVGRVHFNLAENGPMNQAPFAFMRPTRRRLSAQSRAQHLPLAEALREYAGAKNKARLLSLLKPVQEGARESHG